MMTLLRDQIQCPGCGRIGSLQAVWYDISMVADIRAVDIDEDTLVIDNIDTDEPEIDYSAATLYIYCTACDTQFTHESFVERLLEAGDELSEQSEDDLDG